MTCHAVLAVPRRAMACHDQVYIIYIVYIVYIVMAPYSDLVRDLLEAELCAVAPREEGVRRGNAWRLEEQERWRGPWTHARFAVPGAAAAGRWPGLCSWGWAVPSEELEAALGALSADWSSRASQLEGPEELAYRSVIPKALGAWLCGVDPTQGAADDERQLVLFENRVQDAFKLGRGHQRHPLAHERLQIEGVVDVVVKDVHVVL